MDVKQIQKSVNIGNEISVTLTNGNVKNGLLNSINIEYIELQINGNITSIMNLMIGMIEPINNNTENHIITKLNELEKAFEENNQTLTNKKNLVQEHIIHRIISIEANFNASILNSDIIINPPDFTTPSEIVGTNQGIIISEEQRIWSWIKQKYDNYKKNGSFNPNNDDLKVLIDKTQVLIQKFPKKSTFYNYLGYFNLLRNQKQQSIQAYQNAVLYSNSGIEWFNLAAIGINWNEFELTNYSLEQFFVNSYISEHEKAWYLYCKLTNEFKSFLFFNNVLENEKRVLLKDDLIKIFETICYFLIMNNQKDFVNTLIEKEIPGCDYKALIIEGIKSLPQESTPLYKNMRLDFSKQIFNQAPLVKQTVLQTNIISKNVVSTKQRYDYYNDFELLREARKANLRKDFVKAEELFRKALKTEKIAVRDKITGTRDLAAMLDSLQRTEDAIELINNQTVKEEADYQLLKSFNFRLGNFEKALQIEKQLLKKIPSYSKDKKALSYIFIGNCYLRLEKFGEAESNYRSVILIQPNNYFIKRTIAICLYKQGKAEDAKKLLNELIKNYNDLKSEQLLTAFLTPNAAQSIFDIEEIIIATTLNVNPIDLDKFTLFYLNQSKLEGVPPERIKDNKYEANAKDRKYDLDKLEDAASTFGTKRPEDRSNYYLSAAKIIIDSDTKQRKLYKYLCRSFTSKADEAVYKRLNIDTIKTFYLQALKVYDSYTFDEEDEQKQNFDEQDAINALYRYLYALLGINEIPVAAKKVDSFENQFKQIQDSCADVFNKCFNVYGNYNKFFESINLSLTYCPQYVAKRLLKVIFDDQKFQSASLQFLKYKIHSEIEKELTFENYVSQWRIFTDTTNNAEYETFNQLRLLINFELSTIWLENAKNKVSQLIAKSFFDLDNEYLNKSIKIFDTSISLCNSNQYDEKISRHNENYEEIKNLIFEIEKNPTKLSVEEIMPIFKTAQKVLKDYLHKLNETTKPVLEIEIPYISSLIDSKVEVQIKITNKAEGPAEYVELIIDEDLYNYSLDNYSVSYGTIRGGTQDIRIVPINLKPEIINKNAFSLNVYVRFKSKQSELINTEKELLSVEIPNPIDFIEIKPNPFSTYAIGGEVKEDDMFYGREDFINRAFNSICNNYKSYVIFGQKRAGKSSILYHLEQKIKKQKNILTANIGNIGSLYNPYSNTPFMYSFLFDILQKISYGIEDKECEGFAKLNFSIPTDLDFYNHPNPIQSFKNILENFKRTTQRSNDWKNMRIIILIDEFTYIYTFIIGGKIEDSTGMSIEVKAGTVDNSFMMNWKSLLQSNFFSVALVAQDFFPKFKQSFPNEFQTMDFERVSYLDDIYAKRLIDEPIKIGGKNGDSRYREKAIDRIYKLTAGSPFYIQIFCDRLVEYINKEKQLITEANVNAVKEKLIKGDKRLDKTLFDNLINDGDTSPDAIHNSDLEKVLRDLAENTKNSDFGNLSTDLKTSRNLKDIIDNLINREVIEQNNNTYKIRVGLFKEWLNANK